MVECRRRDVKATALVIAISQERDVMNIHRALEHPHESTRATAKWSSNVLTGKWVPSRSTPSPRTPGAEETSTKATKRLSCVGVDLLGVMKHSTVEARHYAMEFIDYFTTITFIRNVRNKETQRLA